MALPSDPHPVREGGHPEGGGIPWIDPTLQQQVSWRDGDIVISVPAKSGTTWTMNIVHQLRSGGDPDLDDIYAEVPWLELIPKPDTVRADLVARFDAMTHDRRRAFKTHSAAGDLPYVAPGSGPDVRYLVVVRNPDEAIASLRPFIASHSDAWFDLWQMPKEAVVGPDFPTFFAGVSEMGMVGGIFEFVASWWPLRHNDNVLLLHFADMKRDLEASVRRIAGFLGFEPGDEQWADILEYTSFAWMKAHEDKFELRSVSDIPPLDPGAMIRKGQIGKSAEDGITPEISAVIAETAHRILPDQGAFDWCYNGGTVPA
jgi:aryl sulfotransferase